MIFSALTVAASSFGGDAVENDVFVKRDAQEVDDFLVDAFI